MSRRMRSKYSLYKRSERHSARIGSPDFQLVSDVYAHLDKLSDWERKFITSLWNVKPRLVALTDKQRIVVNRLKKKVEDAQ